MNSPRRPSSSIEIVVSACLAGEECRYDCQSKTRDPIVKLVEEGKAIALCPEQLGDLPTPRPPAEQVKDKVITVEGNDVTSQYNLGAQRSWEKIKNLPIKKAYLKSKSPMCGFNQIYDGSFRGLLIEGQGVFTQLLLDKGISIESID